MGWLERMTQFKAKAAAQESIGDGLFQYPVLMAADILLYQAAIVPVGEDQMQHLELTRDIAQRFNSLYGETFRDACDEAPAVGARIMGLDDPTTKMSKSATGSGHAVALLDPPERIRKTIMRATTDSNPAVDFETMGPGVANLLNIFRPFSEWTNDGDDQMKRALHRHALRRSEEAGGGDGGRIEAGADTKLQLKLRTYREITLNYSPTPTSAISTASCARARKRPTYWRRSSWLPSSLLPRTATPCGGGKMTRGSGTPWYFPVFPRPSTPCHGKPGSAGPWPKKPSHMRTFSGTNCFLYAGRVTALKASDLC
jgi:hypothetical protein